MASWSLGVHKKSFKTALYFKGVAFLAFLLAR